MLAHTHTPELSKIFKDLSKTKSLINEILLEAMNKRILLLGLTSDQVAEHFEDYSKSLTNKHFYAIRNLLRRSVNERSLINDLMGEICHYVRDLTEADLAEMHKDAISQAAQSCDIMSLQKLFTEQSKEAKDLLKGNVEQVELSKAAWSSLYLKAGKATPLKEDFKFILNNKFHVFLVLLIFLSVCADVYKNPEKALKQFIFPDFFIYTGLSIFISELSYLNAPKTKQNIYKDKLNTNALLQKSIANYFANHKKTTAYNLIYEIFRNPQPQEEKLPKQNLLSPVAKIKSLKRWQLPAKNVEPISETKPSSDNYIPVDHPDDDGNTYIELSNYKRRAYVRYNTVDIATLLNNPSLNPDLMLTNIKDKRTISSYSDPGKGLKEIGPSEKELKNCDAKFKFPGRSGARIGFKSRELSDKEKAALQDATEIFSPVKKHNK